MTDFTSETEFFAAHAEFTRKMQEYNDSIYGLDTGFKGELQRRYKEQYPRRKFDGAKVVLEDWYKGVLEEWQGKADALIKERSEFKKLAEAHLGELAKSAEMPTTDEMIQISMTDGGWYHTQGYGANSYAKGAARSEADKAEYHGLKTEVRTLEKQKADRWGISYETYGVFANTTEAGIALLNYKEAPPLREEVRMCWKRGVNPRVYMPFLPHGYEEQEGLDYYGNDLRAVENSAPAP